MATPHCPLSPQAVALYLGHLASTGRSIATVQQARSASSHFHAAASSPLSRSRIYRASLTYSKSDRRGRSEANRQQISE